jgi:hypothetical protein
MCVWCLDDLLSKGNVCELLAVNKLTPFLLITILLSLELDHDDDDNLVYEDRIHNKEKIDKHDDELEQEQQQEELERQRQQHQKELEQQRQQQEVLEERQNDLARQQQEDELGWQLERDPFERQQLLDQQLVAEQQRQQSGLILHRQNPKHSARNIKSTSSRSAKMVTLQREMRASVIQLKRNLAAHNSALVVHNSNGGSTTDQVRVGLPWDIEHTSSGQIAGDAGDGNSGFPNIGDIYNFDTDNDL